MYNITGYWLKIQFGLGRKWTTFTHNGVMFPPEYEPHGIPVIYNNQEIILNKEAEEYATIYAKYTETEYIKSKTFNKNFWNDWKKYLNNNTIKSLDDCNFKLIYDYILQTKNTPKQNKEELKQEEEKYKYAIVDGKKQKVGNFKIEPPGIFLGRGCNPKSGKIKKRIYPEDIIINIDKESKIPETIPNHQWGKVIHDRTVEWLASWKDDITGKTKYVWLSHDSDFKAQSDMNKFELARKLKRKIKDLRKMNEENLISDDIYTKQIATAVYLIDKLAIRVGNEKGEDETDTVGVSSLRVEHIELLENNNIKLDFMGKDYVRYVRKVEIDKIPYDNLKLFMNGKQNDDQIFDQITPNDINIYLQTFMKGLTAKVFRTYNASNLFQKELFKIDKKYENNTEDIINMILDDFNMANAKVALLCNHQKNISKSFNDQLDKINEKIKNVKSKIKKAKTAEKANEMRHRLEILKKKKQLKIELKNVSLGTSKINYIDPRITIAFMKRHNLAIDKIFTAEQIRRFDWAMKVGPDYKF